MCPTYKQQNMNTLKYKSFWFILAIAILCVFWNPINLFISKVFVPTVSLVSDSSWISQIGFLIPVVIGYIILFNKAKPYSAHPINRWCVICTIGLLYFPFRMWGNFRFYGILANLSYVDVSLILAVVLEIWISVHIIYLKRKTKTDNYDVKKFEAEIPAIHDDFDRKRYAELLVNKSPVLDRSIDDPDSCTFKPQRLNITCRIPEEYIDDFRAGLPEEFAPYIDESYEVQIRTIFSEGWHEVEHDLRYKCKEDWVGYENYSRTLNGVIATLETAEWSMTSLFKQMAYDNYCNGNYSAMLRNHLRVRIKGKGLSPKLCEFLRNHTDVAFSVYNMDRMVFLFSVLLHKSRITLDYDTALFLINRMEIQNMDLMALEDEETKEKIGRYLRNE